MNPYDQIRMLARQYPVGIQHGGLHCPFCYGGRHGDKALSIITKDDGTTLFICHRAQCGKSGRVDGHGGETAPSEERGFFPRWFEEETRNLTDTELGVLLSRWGIDPAQASYHGLVVCKEMPQRLVVPVYGTDFVAPRGHMLRQLIHRAEPRCLTFKIRDEPWLGWFMGRGGKTTVIVEDVISAIRVSRQYECVALCGSHITVEDMIEIVANGEDDIVLCLDRDATDKAFAFQKKYMYLAPKMRVVPLLHDLKYETDERIRELIEG